MLREFAGALQHPFRIDGQIWVRQWHMRHHLVLSQGWKVFKNTKLTIMPLNNSSLNISSAAEEEELVPEKRQSSSSDETPSHVTKWTERDRLNLPLSPLMDSKLISARQRHRTQKPKPDRERSVFQNKLLSNPYGESDY